MRKLTKIIGHQEGQSIIETLIVLPLILFLILIIMELSMIYNAKQVCNYAAFCAARTASVYGTSDEAKEKMHRSAAIALSCITPTIVGDAFTLLDAINIPHELPEALRPIIELIEGTFLHWPLRFVDAYLRSRIDTVIVGDYGGRQNVTVELIYYYKCQIFPIGRLIGDGGFAEFLYWLKNNVFPNLPDDLIEGLIKYRHYNIKIRASAKMDYWHKETQEE
ncbi:MAG: TadE/TadG family type IV pilus assembly protein [candidate division WOR-3 bacterium]